MNQNESGEENETVLGKIAEIKSYNLVKPK